jgi:CRP/FNR family transcriptional regulator, dissimilatory nitrate respiration regulator
MEKTLDVMARIPLFSGLHHGQLAQFQGIALEKSFVKGELIFSEGDEGNGFYVILAGTVKIFKVSPDGKEHILHIFTAGQPFGEVPVFAGEHFPANAEALQETRALFFPRSAFVALLEKNPALSLKLLADLSLKLRQFTVQIESLSLKEIPARLATYLLYLAEEQGRNDQVTLSISKGQLASLLGTIPETLSRIFAKLSSQQLIQVEGRKITLLDAAGLEDLAQSGKSV